MKTMPISILLSFALLATAALAQRGPQDNFVYEPDLGWGSVGSGQGQFQGISGSPLLLTMGIAVDATNVFVADAGNNRIQVFDKSGAFVRQFGGVANPMGLALGGDELYVTERLQNRIQVFSKTGALLRTWGVGGTNAGQLATPRALAVDTQMVFVADTFNSRIQVFDKTGGYVRAWGSFGTQSGQFKLPTGVALDRQYVFVADSNNGRIQVFDRNGGFVRSWALPGSAVNGGSDITTMSLAADLHGVFVGIGSAQYGPQRVLAYDKFGAQLWTNAASDGPLGLPAGLAMDSPYLYVANLTPGVRVFRRIFRTLGGITNDPIPLANVLSVVQRPGTRVLDVDYELTDGNDATLTAYAGAFRVTTNTALSLSDFHPIRTLIDGTATNLGPGLSTGSVYRLSWDLDADGASASLGDYGQLKASIFVRDGRNLLDLHFLSIPAVGTNPAVTINRVPLFHHDLLPVWFWWLAAGDTNLVLTTGTVFGTAAPYAGVPLAQGTNTTTAGRDFLFGRLDLRQATAAEVAHARGGFSSTIATNTPRRQPPPEGFTVNEFNFVTWPTNGWNVVPLP